MGQRLLLYGLYKQALAGDAPLTPPVWAHVIERTKHRRWAELRGMPQASALKHEVDECLGTSD